MAGIYGGAWSGPVVVVTHRPDDLASVPGIDVVADLDHGLERAQHLAGDKHLGIFGGDLAGQVLARGLLDEIVVQLVPVVLGGGVPLFGERAGSRVALERTHLGSSGRLTDIRFRVLPGGSITAS